VFEKGCPRKGGERRWREKVARKGVREKVSEKRRSGEKLAREMVETQEKVKRSPARRACDLFKRV